MATASSSTTTTTEYAYALSLSDVQAAHERIKPHVHRTPVLTCQSLDSMAGGGRRLFFKCENFQRGGAFKIRGATNACLLLPDSVKTVVTHSSGNHAQGVALAAKSSGKVAHIVMPDTAPRVKVAAVKGYGATVYECPPLERAATAEKVRSEVEGVLIHPSNDPNVIAGQGTMVLEMLEQVRDLIGMESSNSECPMDVLVVPLGGGGMLSGICIAAKALHPDLVIIGAEPANANDASRSKQAGELLGHNKPIKTVADGLCTTLGSNTWPIVRDLCDKIIEVSEEDIIKGMKIVYERMKLVVEGSAGTGVAVALFNEEFKAMNFPNNRVGVVLCGGNVNLDKLPWQMD